MEKYTTGQILDVILQYASETKEGYVDISDVKNNLFPELNDDEIRLLFSKILNTRDNVAEIQISEYNAIVSVNGLTKRFLQQGGFSSIEEKENKSLKKQKELDDIEFEKSKIDLQLAKETLKEFPKTKRRAKIAYIIAIILAVLQLVKWIISLASKN